MIKPKRNLPYHRGITTASAAHDEPFDPIEATCDEPIDPIEAAREAARIFEGDEGGLQRSNL